MNGSHDLEYLYYVALGLCVCLIPVYYYFNSCTYSLNVTKPLDNLRELLEYSDFYLSDIFGASGSHELASNFLNNKFLFNFFKNLLILYPSPELLAMDFPPLEKSEILHFFDSVQKNSFELFRKNPIKKKTFYNLIYYINKNIFCLDI